MRAIRSICPLPIEDLRHIFSVFCDVCPVINELVAKQLFGLSADCLELRDAIDDILSQMEAIKPTSYRLDPAAGLIPA